MPEQQPIDRAQLDEIQRQVEQLNEKNIDPALFQSAIEKITSAIHSLAPSEPSGPSGLDIIASLTPAVALVAAIVAAVIGALNLRHQRKALEQKEIADAKALEQKEIADAKAEWWRRIQWALAAVATENNEALNNYGAAVLNVMAENNNLTAEERDIFEAVSKTGVNEIQISTLLQAAGDLGLLSDDLNEVNLGSSMSSDETAEPGVASNKAPTELAPESELESNIVLSSGESSERVADPVVEDKSEESVCAAVGIHANSTESTTESATELLEVTETARAAEDDAVVDTAGNPVDNEVTDDTEQRDEVRDDSKNIRPKQEG